MELSNEWTTNKSYQRFTPSVEDPEKVYYDIPSYTQFLKRTDIVTDSSNTLSITSTYNEMTNKK